jgi:hypothetical protein
MDFCGVPGISVSELELELPCSESLWAASSSSYWRSLFVQEHSLRGKSGSLWDTILKLTNTDHGNLVTMQQVLAQLRIGNRVTLFSSDFARLVIIFALYRTAKSMQDMKKNAFLSKVLEEQPFFKDSFNESMSAIQSLGLTNSSSRSKLSDSVTCHTYYILMLLNTPSQALLNYAHSWNRKQEQPNVRETISEWITEQNGCISRRAVSYAGLLLGKATELRFQAPSTPIMIAMSILIIWAYSHMIETESPERNPRVTVKTNKRGYLVRLDDGELDQQRQAWIHGDMTFYAHLKDVGNVCSEGAASRIIDVGLKALRDLGGWGFSHSLELWLSNLRNRGR